MIKIRMLTSMAGVRHSFARNDIVLREDDEAQRFIDAGIAELAPEDAKVTAEEPAGDVDDGTGDPRYSDDCGLLGSDTFGPTVATRYGEVSLGDIVRAAYGTSAAETAAEWNALPAEDREALIVAEAISRGSQPPERLAAEGDETAAALKPSKKSKPAA